MTNLHENMRKRRTKILVMLAANPMSEQSLENTFVPLDQDLVHWSSYLKKKNAYNHIHGPYIRLRSYLSKIGSIVVIPERPLFLN